MVATKTKQAILCTKTICFTAQNSLFFVPASCNQCTSKRAVHQPLKEYSMKVLSLHNHLLNLLTCFHHVDTGW
ncbi:hypothetical protein DEM91_02290 [Prevotella sp. TCVGH]|nr:hypothetical protein [Prevotella sp. TCVGH]